MIKLYGMFKLALICRIIEFEGRFIDIMEVFNVDKYEFNIKLEQIKKLAAKKKNISRQRLQSR